MATRQTRIGLLHPGEMGSAVGGALQERGAAVVWLGEGRSPSTRARAEKSALREVPSLAALLGESEVVLSICPPAAAVEVASMVVSGGFSGIFVDANAISPGRAQEIGRSVAGSACRFVDGAIVGGPPAPGAGTRLYLCGSDASQVAALLTGSDRVSALVLDGPVGAASALKMCYSAWSKGGNALLLAALSAAGAIGVEEALMREWSLSQPEALERLQWIGSSTSRKAWRFVDEMEQIAESLAEVGVPPGFGMAAAEVYSRLAHFRGLDPGPDLQELLRAVRDENIPEGPGAVTSAAGP